MKGKRINDKKLNRRLGILRSYSEHRRISFGYVSQKKIKSALINPLLIAVIAVIAVLLTFNIDYDTYSAGAEYLTYLLTPATVALAIPLYEKLSILKKHFAAVMLGIFSGVVSSFLCVLLFAYCFGLSHTEYVTFLPKSITTAMGIGVSEELGGIVTITVACIVLTGIAGNVMASAIFRIFRITHPIAQGVACGTAAHAIGTSRAIELGELEGAVSGLSIAVSGVMTVLCISLFAAVY